MNNQFDELAKGLARSVTRRAALKKFDVGLAGLALACLAMTNAALAQTSVVCDPAGDAAISSGKAKGSGVPPWLDLRQAAVTADANGNIRFTLTVNSSIPMIPDWSAIDDGGQLTWSWRLIGDLADLTIVRNGCLGGNGTTLPACYYLDLIWSVQTASFQARLLDNTSCTQVAIPFVFSADRTQVTLVVSKSSLANQSLIPDPDNFQYLAATVVWKSNSMGNVSYKHIDWAPDLSNGQLVLCSWSASRDYACFCP